jgi:hypothetical protein
VNSRHHQAGAARPRSHRHRHVARCRRRRRSPAARFLRRRAVAPGNFHATGVQRLFEGLRSAVGVAGTGTGTGRTWETGR